VKVIDTKLPGVVVLKSPKAYGDEPGFFMRASGGFERAALRGARHTRGLLYFVQGNLTYSVKGVLKGVLRRLRFQSPNTQGKLVSVQ